MLSRALHDIHDEVEDELPRFRIGDRSKCDYSLHQGGACELPGRTAREFHRTVSVH
jgi:hypothetical protein